MLEWYHEFWGVCVQQMQINGGDRTVLRLQENVGLKRNAGDLLQVWHPPLLSLWNVFFSKVSKAISIALDKMQQSTTTVGEAAQIWLELLDDEVIKRNAKAKKAVMERSQVVLQSGGLDLFHVNFLHHFSGSFYAANLLDPRFQGQKLSPQQKQQAVQWITNQLSSRFPDAHTECGAAITR